jgi:hypothetical protein
MKKEREELRRPYIQIREYVYMNALERILIKNVGKTAAKSVRFELDRDIFQFGDLQRNIKALSIFENGVEYFPPEMEYHINIAEYQRFFEETRNEYSPPLEFKIICTYFYDSFSLLKKRKMVREETIIDITSTFKTNFAPNPIAEEIQELRKTIEKLITKGH